MMDVPVLDASGPLSNPSYLATYPVDQLDVNGIEFNMNGNFWGVPFNHGTSPAGLLIRQGIAHLVSKANFIVDVLGSKASSVDCFAPHAQLASGSLSCPDPSQSPVAANGNLPAWNVCSWDLNNPNCSSAYYMNSPVFTKGEVQPGSPDFCAAANDFIAAFQMAKLGTYTKDAYCQLQNRPSGVIGIWVSSASESVPLNKLAAAFTDSINSLMSPGCTYPTCPVVDCTATAMGLSSISGADSHFVTDYAASPPDASFLTDFLLPILKTASEAACTGVPWSMAALGWKLDSGIDQSYRMYNSKFAYNGYSSPLLDYWSRMLEYNATVTGSQQSAEAAEYIMGSNVTNIPVWSDFGPFAYVKGWTGVVNQLGVGTSNYWTALNAWNPSPADTGPTIRWGLVAGTSRLNPFTSVTSSERLILGEIYDSLLVQNPYDPQQFLGWMATNYQPMTPAQSSACPNSVTNSKGTFAVGGCVQIQLRGDISWHDVLTCQPYDTYCLAKDTVTASDVKFSFLNFNPIGLIDVIYAPSQLPKNAFSAYGGTKGDGETETLVILLDQLTSFNLLNIASVPIVPQHLWHCQYSGCGSSGTSVNNAAPCSDIGVDTCMVDPSFLLGPSSDTVLNNRLVGSGPFICADRNLANIGVPGQPQPTIGGGCTFDSQANPTGSAVPVGGTAVLKRFSVPRDPSGSSTNTLDHHYSYFRTNAKYLQFQWAAYPTRSVVPASAFTMAIGACKPSSSSVGGVVNYAACQHYNTVASGVLCVPTAGPCNAVAGGGHGTLPNNPIPVLIQISFWRNNGPSWTFGVASYGSLDGAQTFPQSLMEDGSVEAYFSLDASPTVPSTPAGTSATSTLTVQVSPLFNWTRVPVSLSVAAASCSCSGFSSSINQPSVTLGQGTFSAYPTLTLSSSSKGTLTVIVTATSSNWPTASVLVTVNFT